MPLAAILSATAVSSDRPDISRAQLVFASQTLIEYQARQALMAGADQLFVMVEVVTPALSRLVDRIGAEGAQVFLVRDMASLVRQLPRESDVLLFADGMVADQHYVMALAEEEGNALLVVDDEATTAQFERVDAACRWAGVARVAPKTLFNTLDLIGDWDLVLTLLRAVVQNTPRRVSVPLADVREGRVALVETQAGADLVGKALAKPSDSGAHDGAGAERYVIGPVARWIATHLLRMQVSPTHIGWTAAGTALTGLLATLPGWTFLPLLLFLLALLVEMVGRNLAGLTQQGPGHVVLDLAPAAIIAIGVAWIGSQNRAATDGLHLGLLCMAAALVVRKGGMTTLPGWALITPGSVVLFLIAGYLGGNVAAALSVGALLAILSLAALLLLGQPRAEKRKKSR